MNQKRPAAQLENKSDKQIENTIKKIVAEFTMNGSEITAMFIEELLSRYQQRCALQNDLATQLDAALKLVERQGKEIEALRTKNNDVYAWLFGYTDFPMRKEGEGAYWWRKYLRDKLTELGIEFTEPDINH